MSNLGEVPEFPFFAVPKTAGIKFDVFPGAPAVTGTTIAFKGNFTVGNESRTGVYYRDLQDAPAGGDSPAILIANNGETFIPGTDILFGSTAPPSAAIGPPPTYDCPFVVFAGFDNEDNPTAGGIYLAELVWPIDQHTHSSITCLGFCTASHSLPLLSVVGEALKHCPLCCAACCAVLCCTLCRAVPQAPC